MRKEAQKLSMYTSEGAAQFINSNWKSSRGRNRPE